MSREKIKKKLADTFSNGKEAAFLINKIYPVYNYIFDFDGVILQECGIAEHGYAWLIRALRDRNLNSKDINVDPKDIVSAEKFRQKIKGKSPAQKIVAFNFKFGGGREQPKSLEEITSLWFNALAEVIKKRFGMNPKEYLLLGAESFLNVLSDRGKIFGVTANIQSHAKFLMEFVGLKSLFREIYGYPMIPDVGTSKTILLLDMLTEHNLKNHTTCYIGDGKTDISAGKDVGVVTVGIANSLENGIELINEGCDIIATSSAAHEQIEELLLGRKSV